MNPAEHYERAEELLAEGVRVVNQIRSVPDEPLPDHVMAIAEDEYTREWIEQRRDALSKKAMGIWAQAQVHAILATVDGSTASRARRQEGQVSRE